MIITKAEAKARGMTEDKICDFHDLYPDQSALKFCQDCIIIRDPCGCDMDMSCEECDPKCEDMDSEFGDSIMGLADKFSALYGESYKNMETKWEWIASGIHELGYPNLAEMALVIDRHIAELYGKGKVTEEWCNVYDEIYNLNKDPASIRYIINNSDFCYPCSIDNDSDIQQLDYVDCIDCKYGQKYGVCADMDSEFGIFCRIFVGIFAV